MSINKATLIGKSDESLLIRITIVVRRRVGHHPIPKFSDYLNCPPRTRLSNEEFAAKYGASVEDIGRIKSFYKSFGLKLISVHLARRHIILEGSVQQHNAAFGIELHDYEKVHVGKTIRFRSHATPIQLPDHLKSIIHDVWKLENEPKMVPCLVKQTTNPASDPSSTSVISLSTLQSLYKVPTNLATGQNIAIGLFQGWGQFSINDLTSTCKDGGFQSPKLLQLSLMIQSFLMKKWQVKPN
jgi:kumamolisin